jgi:hypothetical protein
VRGGPGRVCLADAGEFNFASTLKMQAPSRDLLAGERKGAAWLVRGAPVLMVEPDPGRVERALVAGELACPRCKGELRPWGRVRRLLRDLEACRRVWLRRSRCRVCRVTHVLLPAVALARRRDLVEVIGAALASKAAGAGHRPIADLLVVPRSTVRGWLRRFAAGAGPIREHFTRLAVVLDGELGPICPRGSPLADAVEAIGMAAAAAARRLGPQASPWQLAAGATAGRLLAMPPGSVGTPGNTSGLFPVVW